jgi:hypothetical protein
VTLNAVRANHENLWEKDHVYVALSRATSLEGLWLEGNKSKPRNKTEADVDVVRFLQETDWHLGHP